MENSQKSYYENIEHIIIENIKEAQSSIHIAVAWFTSGPIKNALLRAKRNRPDLIIEIVVDGNDVNERYFMNTGAEFITAGIVIHKNWKSDFLHRKFTIIDGRTTLNGSYNYTNNARSNAENLNVIINENFAQVHLRVFKRMTNENYFDENMKLLLDYPLFAQKLISTYYPFKRQQYNKYKEKIVIGQCFTHNVGDYDKIAYMPGFIFNTKFKFDRKLRDHEFPLPISKTGIKDWIGGRDEMMIIDSHYGLEEYYHEIGERLDEYRKSFEAFFKIRVDSTHSYEQLKACIESDVDIIKEDRLWSDNFALFMDDHILEKVFVAIPVAENDYWIDFLNDVRKWSVERND
jgi:hypothetical protein